MPQGTAETAVTDGAAADTVGSHCETASDIADAADHLAVLGAGNNVRRGPSW
ncbi:MAG: hypothetical protein IPM93_24010 [Candidatus Obscuribacter sp.]|nr:hypothetical protein [Candidatus Obscuribacter sp.]